MPSLGDVVARYNGLMEQNGFSEVAWAEDLQRDMRQRRLTDSGRLLSPVLRPCFVTQKQLEALGKIAARLRFIFNRLEPLILAKPAILSRLHMLPAEKSLLNVAPGYKDFSPAASFDSNFHSSTCILSGVNASVPGGLAFAGTLADAFLEMRIVKEFARSGYKISKLPGQRRLSHPLLTAWQQFGGKGPPAVAVIDWANTSGDGVSEGELLADVLIAQGMDARFVPPEKLVFSGKELRAGDRRIDVVLRRVTVRDLLTRSDLNHPLLEAYRAQAVCMVNSFRSELAQRRAFLELLSDESVTVHLEEADRKLLRQNVRWTRILSARKVEYHGDEVDLLAFVLKSRERLTLLPDKPAPELRSYAGSEMTAASWEWAVRQALKTPYVVQECVHAPLEAFPFFQYGEFKVRQVEVTLQAQLLGGELGDCMAVLHNKAAGGVTPLGIAPVLLVS